MSFRAMLFLLTVCIIFLPRFLCSKKTFSKIKIEAACTHNTLIKIQSPADIPDDVIFFVITMKRGGETRKIARNSVTVPSICHENSVVMLKQALLLLTSGDVIEITDKITPYVGTDHTFTHHEVPLRSILDLYGLSNAHSISLLWKDVSILGRHFMTTSLL